MTTEAAPSPSPLKSLQELKLPSLAESVVEGEILGWLIAEGDRIEEGQSVLEVMTDKVTVELPAPFSGIVRRLLVGVGAVVPVGTALALIEPGENLPEENAPEERASAPGAHGEIEPPPGERDDSPVANDNIPPTQTISTPSPVTDTAQEGLREERSIIESVGAGTEDPALLAAVFAGWRREAVKASGSATSLPPGLPAPARTLAAPSARRLAREQGLDLDTVTGSGTNGVVQRADVLAHLERSSARVPGPARPSDTWPPPPPAPYRTPAGSEALEDRTPFQGTRRRISQALQASLLYTAQTHTVEDLDCSALVALKEDLREDAARAGVKLGYLPFFLKAVAAALREFPALNSSLDDEKNEIVHKRFVHLGLAVNTDAGLIVPVLRDADRRSVLDLARESAELAESARTGTLKPQQLQDATFTVSNIGAVGALVGVPIVNPPAVGILSLHSIVKRPVAVVHDGQDLVVVRPMMYITLGFDHRLVDGADAARFNRRVVELLERPNLLLLNV
jgi:2-oxoisovalerate dehydrogenase E2 component (dihydrolipoyl transacylase)